MRADPPLVSIIVRTKDRPKLVRNALQSISSQTYRPIEVVLVNDGGGDLEIDALKRILRDVSLTYIRLEKNTGRAHAGNTGMRNAKGDFIGFLDDDDLLYPDHLSTLMSVIAARGVKVAYSDAYLVYMDCAPGTLEMTVKEKKVFSSGDFSYGDLVTDNYIPLMTILFSRETLEKAGGFDERFELYEDWDMLIRIAEHSPFSHVAKTTAEYLQWSAADQIAQAPGFAEDATRAHLKIIGKHREKYAPEMIRGLVQTRRQFKAAQEEHERCKRSLMAVEDAEARARRMLQEKEAALDLIYRSQGWKLLLSYYKMRDLLLPPGSRRRTFFRALFRRVPSVSGTPRVRGEFPGRSDEGEGVLRGAETSAERSGGDETRPEFGEAVKDREGILIIGDGAGEAETSRAGWEHKILECVRGLDYAVSFMGPDISAEEYLKENGDRFSFVIGTGPELCLRSFPFVRAYAPQSGLLYLASAEKGGNAAAELLNASVSDGVIAGSREKKDSLLQRNAGIHVDIVGEGGDMQVSLRNALAALRDRRAERRERFQRELGRVDNHEGRHTRDGGKTAEAYPSADKGSVLVAGIYLANQENAVSHIVRELGRSRNFRVSQRWAALCGEAPSEDVGAVTVLKSAAMLPKVALINRLLSGVALQKYDYLVLCDDDIILPDDFLDTFLGLQEEHDFAAAQPARTHNSYIDHPFVEQLDGVRARVTRFVEIGPLVSFRRDIVPSIIPLDEATPMGWGFDFVLPCVAERQGLRIGIIDGTPVDHSLRRPMHNYHFEDAKQAMEAYLSVNPHLSRDEAFRIVESYP